MTLFPAVHRIRTLQRTFARQLGALALLAAAIPVLEFPAHAQNTYNPSHPMAGAWRQTGSNYHPCPGCLMAVLPISGMGDEAQPGIAVTGNMCVRATPYVYALHDGTNRTGVRNEVSFQQPHPWAGKGVMEMVAFLVGPDRLEVTIRPIREASDKAVSRNTLTHIFERAAIDPNTISLETIESDIRFRCTTPPTVTQLTQFSAVPLSPEPAPTRPTLIAIGNIVAYRCDSGYQVAVRRDTNDAISLISTNGGQINLQYTGPGEIYKAGTVAVSLVPDRMFLKFGDNRYTCFPQ